MHVSKHWVPGSARESSLTSVEMTENSEKLTDDNYIQKPKETMPKIYKTADIFNMQMLIWIDCLNQNLFLTVPKYLSFLSRSFFTDKPK